mgnify:CR=1 FL=1
MSPHSFEVTLLSADFAVLAEFLAVTDPSVPHDDGELSEFLDGNFDVVRLLARLVQWARVDKGAARLLGEAIAARGAES